MRWVDTVLRELVWDPAPASLSLLAYSTLENVPKALVAYLIAGCLCIVISARNAARKPDEDQTSQVALSLSHTTFCFWC